MTQMMTFFGVPLVVVLSFVIALGVEVLVLSSAIQLMGRAAARAQNRQIAGPKNPAR